MNNIYLVGFMCSGKSTVGKLLAEKTGRKFVDIDTLIEDEEGKKISQIFEEKGEAYFRELERKKIEELSKQKGLVVSTGGGLGANLENMNIMKKKGVVIWLQISFEEVKNRCGSDTNRPILNLPEDRLKKLFEEREQVYKLSDISLSTENKTPEEIVNQILFLIKLIEKR